MKPKKKNISAPSSTIRDHSKIRKNGNNSFSTLGKQFKKVLKMGNKPDGDLWDGMKNRFDDEEWV